tara:strand:+ start:1010 stop:1399 length:390 start_codon:yes stop_codon:yes gene_type:complete
MKLLGIVLIAFVLYCFYHFIIQKGVPNSMPQRLRQRVLQPFTAGSELIAAPPLVGAELSSSSILSEPEETVMIPEIDANRELNGFIVEDGVNPLDTPVPTQSDVVIAMLNAARKREEMIEDGSWAPLVA